MKVLLDRAEFDGSPVMQHVGEKISYSCVYQTNPDTCTSVTIYDVDGTDKSSTMLSGSAVLSGDTIATPLVQNVTAGDNFKVVVAITRSGNTLINYFWVYGAA